MLPKLLVSRTCWFLVTSNNQSPVRAACVCIRCWRKALPKGQKVQRTEGLAGTTAAT